MLNHILHNDMYIKEILYWNREDIRFYMYVRRLSVFVPPAVWDFYEWVCSEFREQANHASDTDGSVNVNVSEM